MGMMDKLPTGLMEKIPAFVNRLPGGAIVMAPVDWAVNEVQASSLWYMLFGLACCAIELMATGAARYDFDRLGMIFRATPRQSDLMIVAGTLTLKMAPRVKLLYEQMSEPRYVIAMGGCTMYGGPFYHDGYSVLKGVDKIIPVDVHIAGCPPRPEGLLNGCLVLQQKIRKHKLGQDRGPSVVIPETAGLVTPPHANQSVVVPVSEIQLPKR